MALPGNVCHVNLPDVGSLAHRNGSVSFSRPTIWDAPGSTLVPFLRGSRRKSARACALEGCKGLPPTPRGPPFKGPFGSDLAPSFPTVLLRSKLSATPACGSSRKASNVISPR